ncbi:forkhead transcription factor fkh1 [Grosmannia clavigera kw1407]|uniref:Forkhead transcription factor fkh1 n=1 Tax=Grosmannia clavigera (strain kw1407 / UAMH 11150) TaxID=655863 RepID=F0XAL9_GROCL|nr:forkhead transcription factor fkh1 [Grosmannia clavigera kw1407]EFX05505.1 forkhead transcription factor fkh1 [Grosmannia clavigera kw1407]
MPTPRRSSQRTRRNSWRKETTVDLPDSSPSRPAKRRKQATDESPRDIPEEEPSSLLADSSAINPTDETQIVTRVAQHLLSPHEDPVRASKDHSNAIHEANKEGVQAYAKIAAQDWTFYVTKLTVNIGRTSEPPPEYPKLYDPDGDPEFVHIDLGPSKMVSRQHAQIVFNTKSEKWFVHVKGRNGVKVNNMPWRLGQSKPLGSGDVIEVGGVEMMFVLPLETSPLNINDIYLQRAGFPKSEREPSHLEETPSRPRLRATTPQAAVESSPRGSTMRSALPRGQPTPQPIAPAPPDYKRPGTPPSARSRISVPGSHLRSPQFRDIPTMVVHPSDVDLSLDENKNMKPQYSYAQMITQAIMNTSDGKLNLNGIYNFIMDNYSYYKHQQAAGWQNSIRHNLSLNKAFEKVARSTEEPGKGMKWYILPEYKDEMVRTAYRGGRGGHRGSSNPSSPSQLNYVNQGPRDMAARDLGSARKRRVSPSGSPQPRSTLRDMHLTPDRSSRRLLPDEAPASSDGSPLPRYRRGAAAKSASNNGGNAATAAADGSALSTASESVPRSPILTSAFLQDDTVSSFVTPAPHRVELKLNPPSTLQRPSQHMPTSSPAPFWKYADIGSTPLKSAVAFDFSPSKTTQRGRGGSGALPASSSPPPAATRTKSPSSSPSRPSRTIVPEPAAELKEAESATNTTDSETVTDTAAALPVQAVDVEEDGGFDLTKGFQSIGSYHAPVRHGLPVATAMNGNQ